MEQIERTRRYLERIRRIYLGVPNRDDARVYYGDDVDAFFVHCHHILDWAGALNRVGVTTKDLQTYINAHDELRICADLCTGTKHCEVARLRTEHQPHIMRFSRTASRREDGQMVATMEFGIHANGQMIDALDLAETCMDLWDEFILDFEQFVPDHDES